MSRLDELIQELCPNGVEYKKLSKVTKIERGKRVVKKQLSQDSGFPVFQNSLTPMGYHVDSNYPAETTFIIGAGSAGEIGYSKENFWAADDCFPIVCSDSVINRYIFHFLLKKRSVLLSKVRKSSIPRLSRTVIENLMIPVPPLKVQEEIVRILDKFTTLEAELTAELTARKKQYEHYRNKLFSFNVLNYEAVGNSLNNIIVMPLGEIGELVRGNGLQKKDLINNGVPAIHYGQIYTYYGVYTDKTISFVSSQTAMKLRKVIYGDVIITNTSENIEDVGKAVTYLVKEQGVTGGHATIFKPSEKILGKYLTYYTQTDNFARQKRIYAKGTKVIDLSTSDLAKIKIPVPSIEEQRRIVSILDKFDMLTTSISEGLPKEIELRRKQYEYYRNQLLSFPDNKATA